MKEKAIKQRVKLSDHYTFRNILRATIAPMAMMVFTSLYGIVDGFFVANYASESSFAGINLVYPLIMIIGGIGFVYGTGGTALVSKYLGEQNREKANKVFSLLVYFTIALGIAFSIAGYFLIEPFVNFMATFSTNPVEGMIEEANKYGRIMMLGQSLFMLQNLFNSFYMVDEKPSLGFGFTLAAGISNMFFDFLFIGVFKMGVYGAAVATIIGYAIGGMGGLVYFFTHKNDLITLGKATFEFKPILKSTVNGISEFINNVSSSIVSICYNVELLKYYGENGVSSYGILMYVGFIFVALFIGYSMGMAPVVGFNYGAKNHDELKNVHKKSIGIMFFGGLAMLVLSELCAYPFCYVFANSNEELLALATTAMRYQAFELLFAGLSIWISGFFTALNNGLISGIVSFLRTIVIKIAFVFLLPLIFGGVGIWIASPLAELLSLLIAIAFLIANKKRYGY